MNPLPISEDLYLNEPLEPPNFMPGPVSQLMEIKPEPYSLPLYVWNAINNVPESGTNRGKRIRVVEFDLHKDRFTKCHITSNHSLFFEFIADEEKDQIYHDFFRIKYKRSEADFSAKYSEDRTIEYMLRNGIEVEGCEYNLVGCSNSQVQSTSFVFMRGNKRCRSNSTNSCLVF